MIIFTIVEMMINIIVIVIAVIAILSAVLIPTFGSVVANAEKAAAQADARAIYTEYVAYAAENGYEVKTGKLAVKVDDAEYVIVENGQAIEVEVEGKKLVILTADQAKAQLGGDANDTITKLDVDSDAAADDADDKFEIYVLTVVAN